jgi:hypothetical protein
MRIRDQGPTVLRRAVYAALFVDLKVMDTKSDDVPYHMPFRPSSQFRIKVPRASDVVKAGLSAMLRKNATFIRAEFELQFDVDIVVDDVLKLAKNEGGKTIFGNSMECSLVCSRRKVPIKRPMTISVLQPFDAQRDYRVIAYRALEHISLENTSNCTCRHHDVSVELHCSYYRMRMDTEWGIPLIFVQNADSQYAIVLPLPPNHTEYLDVIAQCKPEAEIKLKVVNLSRVRTRCLFVFDHGTFYVFIGGERVFRHLQ